MKLKKAMKKYDIKVTEPRGKPPEGGVCVERQYNLGNKKMWYDDGGWRLYSYRDCADNEEQAVAWLIEGATPLSPMERACKKWPIEKKDDGTYKLGDRHVFQSSVDDYWMECDTSNGMTKYTESEAVAYLLEGYKPEPKLFSMISFLNKSGRTIHAGDVLTKNEVTREWHKCPICGKWQSL